MKTIRFPLPDRMDGAGLPDARMDPSYLSRYLDNLLELTREQQAYHVFNARNYII